MHSFGHIGGNNVLAAYASMQARIERMLTYPSGFPIVNRSRLRNFNCRFVLVSCASCYVLVVLFQMLP